MRTKTCRTCGSEKALTDFFANARLRDGRLNHCKACVVAGNRERRRKNPKKYANASKVYQRKWRKKNPGRMRATVKAWQKKNREHHLATRRRARLRRTYGLTPEDFDRAVAMQGGRCAICGDPPSAGSRNTERLHVDHCHTTKRVRGLLCTNCNRAIGYLKDSPERARALASYLEFY